MKIAIVTLEGEQNYGNRLQCYALQEKIKKIYPNSSIDVIVDDPNSISIKIKNYLRKIINKKNKNPNKKGFYLFEKLINYKQNIRGIYFPRVKERYDKYFVGSDQVWNVGKFGVNKKFFLAFTLSDEKYSYASSLGISEIPSKFKKQYIKNLKKFKLISVREYRGKELIENLTGRKDIEVMVDPTMLLTEEDWDLVAKKPAMLNSKKYILNYFLGDLTYERKEEIMRVAKENSCEIIDILDKNSPFYECGPSEFLYLEKNAFLICTDSFHSSVFAILYNTPFIIFNRIQDDVLSMNSRLETLLSKFDLEERWFKGRINKKMLKCNYSKAYKILNSERIKADKFLRQALNIKDSD